MDGGGWLDISWVHDSSVGDAAAWGVSMDGVFWLFTPWVHDSPVKHSGSWTDNTDISGWLRISRTGHDSRVEHGGA